MFPVHEKVVPIYWKYSAEQPIHLSQKYILTLGREKTFCGVYLRLKKVLETNVGRAKYHQFFVAKVSWLTTVYHPQTADSVSNS